ncbi:PA2779 family protein [Methylotenera mobilis]|uniref:PA2779 family protein n=1 Tax=Methylotenera mobilis (strain JLW8 / ATCC BAA-1282 / DSM 17540) TaxID=583345 RepID=C6WX78_METML|nr:PA2779 family protein [Methylotenera mobilis]ACT48527.1 conserved hypothetical protein [Methylotenera mobilis JLW8]
MIFVKRFFSTFLAASILFTGSVQTVQAAMISSAQVAESAFSTAGDQDRARIVTALSRQDVQAALIEKGIDPAQARSRVASLTDEEASAMATQIENAPAGSGIIGAIVLVFLVLLLTDILGFTKVYPFTRSIR